MTAAVKSKLEKKVSQAAADRPSAYFVFTGKANSSSTLGCVQIAHPKTLSTQVCSHTGTFQALLSPAPQQIQVGSSGKEEKNSAALVCFLNQYDFSNLFFKNYF